MAGRCGSGCGALFHQAKPRQSTLARDDKCSTASSCFSPSRLTRDKDEPAVEREHKPGPAARPDAEAEAVERLEPGVRLLGVPAPGKEEEVEAVEDGWAGGGREGRLVRWLRGAEVMAGEGRTVEGKSPARELGLEPLEEAAGHVKGWEGQAKRSTGEEGPGSDRASRWEERSGRRRRARADEVVDDGRTLTPLAPSLLSELLGRSDASDEGQGTARSGVAVASGGKAPYGAGSSDRAVKRFLGTTAWSK